MIHTVNEPAIATTFPPTSTSTSLPYTWPFPKVDVHITGKNQVSQSVRQVGLNSLQVQTWSRSQRTLLESTCPLQHAFCAVVIPFTNTPQGLQVFRPVCRHRAAWQPCNNSAMSLLLCAQWYFGVCILCVKCVYAVIVVCVYCVWNRCML